MNDIANKFNKLDKSQIQNKSEDIELQPIKPPSKI